MKVEPKLSTVNQHCPAYQLNVCAYGHICYQRLAALLTYHIINISFSLLCNLARTVQAKPNKLQPAPRKISHKGQLLQLQSPKKLGGGFSFTFSSFLSGILLLNQQA